MNKYVFIIIILFAARVSAQQNVLKEGHRGCRGLMPENTIAAMKKAIDLGTDVLELDVVISKDKKVVVSHDAYMSADFCLKPSGDSITADEQRKIILYAMTYDEIKSFDVGSKHHMQFPEQENFKAYKPLLSELIDSSDDYARRTGRPLPRYNIEIKSNPKTDGIEQPEPQEFVALVLDVCKSRKMVNRMNIQSFDVRPLQLIHQLNPEVKLALLTMNQKTVEDNLHDLGFTPDIYSPYYKTVTAESVKYCHEKKMQVIPWTINTKDEMNSAIALGVDGIITDYPNLFNAAKE